MNSPRRSAAGLHGRAVCRAVGPDLLRHAEINAEVVRVRKAQVEGMFRGERRALDVIEWEHDNALLNQGLERALRLISGSLRGSLSAITHVMVSGAAGAVTAATTTIGTPNSIKPVSPAETIDTAAMAVTYLADFDETDITWAATRLGVGYGPAPTDVADIVGGGGSAPYDKSFGFDFTGAGEVDLTLGIKLSLTAVG